MSSATNSTQNKWMIQMSPQLTQMSPKSIEEIKSELKMITKLAKCDVIYIELDPIMQSRIRTTIGYALLLEQCKGNLTSNPPRSLTNDLFIDVIYQFFGVKVNTTLRIWKNLNENGLAIFNNATPRIKSNDKRISFHARTLPQTKNVLVLDDTKKLMSESYPTNTLSLIYGYCRNHEHKNKCIIPKELIKMIMYYFDAKRDILIIKDTQKLITEICTPNAKLLAYGYCRKYQNQYNCNIPWYLITIIVQFFNITLNHLNDLLIK